MPDFYPAEDEFMKRFDEDGNFVNPPVEEEIVENKTHGNLKYVYEYKETPKYS